MDPLDSIDGFGMTFAHLSDEGKQILLFRLLRRGLLTEQLVRDLGAQTEADKAKHDAAQKGFDEVGRTPSTSTSTSPRSKKS